MARPEGFEPPTNRFEAGYSIQLSYGRIAGKLCDVSYHIHLKHNESMQEPDGEMYNCDLTRYATTLFGSDLIPVR